MRSCMKEGKGISVVEHTGFLFQASKKRKETGKRQYHGITCKERKKAREATEVDQYCSVGAVERHESIK